MNKGIVLKKIIKTFLIIILIISTIDYIGTIVELRKFPDVDILEESLIVLGYLLTNIALTLSILEMGKNNTRYSIIISLVCMIIRFFYDIFTFLCDGNILEGTYNMDIFIILDLLIIIFLTIFLLKKSKKCLLVLMSLLFIYSIGEILGYPIELFTDWDEFFLMASLLGVVTGNYFNDY